MLVRQLNRAHPRPSSVSFPFQQPASGLIRVMRARLLPLLLLTLGLMPAALAQSTGTPDAPDAPDATNATDANKDLREALRQALATIANLEKRVSQLETVKGSEDPMEAQLRRLMTPVEAAPAQRTVFPSSNNPRIGVYMNAVIESGNVEEKLGENGDRFSLSETEIDFRMPIAPFAEGVLVTAIEDEGNNEFHTTIEEGYANVSLGGLFDFESATLAKIGRFRIPFGRDNQLHTHDLMQVDRPFVITQLLGGEGLIGDGIEFTTPLAHSESKDGYGRTTTLKAALVNGEVFTGEESLLGELADDAGLSLDSDAPVLVARATHYMELSELSNIEVGVSVLDNVGSNAVKVESGSKIDTRMYGVDVLWRNHDDETGVGSWLLQGEAVQSDFDYGKPSGGGFPTGSQTRRGVSVTAQRQLNPDMYAGLRVGKTDQLGTDLKVRNITPYISWYPDEFFRIRLQGEHLDVDPGSNASRVFLQFSWNFGAHQPHPYWTNR